MFTGRLTALSLLPNLSYATTIKLMKTTTHEIHIVAAAALEYDFVVVTPVLSALAQLTQHSTSNMLRSSIAMVEIRHTY